MKECQHCKACYSDEVDTCPTDGMPTIHTLSGEPVLDGKYHLDSRVGQGGMGVVYKARHSYLKTFHAIKVILPDLVGNDPQLVTRFRQEALAAAAIRHNNVVQVTDYGVAQGTMPFLVMEFVEGESLHDLLARETRLQPPVAYELIAAICSGIGAAHSQGIVHRDMKPLNIMLLKGNQALSDKVKILDFGLAKIKSGELLGSFVQAQTTGLMGSPYYMAPEQWSDEDLGPQSDIYSIGVMLYQMLAGDVPFKGSSIPAIMKKHLSDQPPPFAEKGLSISPALEQAVFHTLRKDPANRTKSVDVLVEELAKAIEGVEAPDKTMIAPPPAAPIKVHTSPPSSDVYLNDVEVGTSKDDGWLLVEGVQSGQHMLRVSHLGFKDWRKAVNCDGTPRQVVAELEPADVTSPGIPMPDETLGAMAGSSGKVDTAAETMIPHSLDPTRHGVTLPKNEGFFSPIILAVIGISGLLLLTAIGATVGVVTGIIPPIWSSKTPTPTETTAATATPPGGGDTGSYKNELVKIEGGKFTMGRNDGSPMEKPEHEVTVGNFSIDKTEVTNGEYYAFVTETEYQQIPVDWVAMSRKPVSGNELLPVRYVNIEDVKSFAAWRSKRDGKTYRLPTEEEWEYVARNGSENNIYPWGDEHRSECAVVGKLAATTEVVGSKKCGASSRWGVQDLIGNVFEWTSSPNKTYPGSKGEVQNQTGQAQFIIRGGSAFRDQNGKAAETSTFRIGVSGDLRDNRLGFRLVSE